MFQAWSHRYLVHCIGNCSFPSVGRSHFLGRSLQSKRLILRVGGLTQRQGPGKGLAIVIVAPTGGPSHGVDLFCFLASFVVTILCLASQRIDHLFQIPACIVLKPRDASRLIRLANFPIQWVVGYQNVGSKIDEWLS